MLRTSPCELAESYGFTGSLEGKACVHTSPGCTLLHMCRNVRCPTSFRKQEQDFQNGATMFLPFFSHPPAGWGNEVLLRIGYTNSLCGHRAPPDTESHEPAFRES